MLIKKLAGEKMYGIGRAAAMCWIHFGNPVEVEIRGQKRILGKYALHLDCPWRIKNSSGTIELGSADIFAPSSGRDAGEAFNWDIQGNNLFDEKAKRLFSKDVQMFVDSVDLSENNDLTVIFSNGFILECFVNASSCEECWRLFKSDSRDGDFIVTGLGIERL